MYLMIGLLIFVVLIALAVAREILRNDPTGKIADAEDTLASWIAGITFVLFALAMFAWGASGMGPRG